MRWRGQNFKGDDGVRIFWEMTGSEFLGDDGVRIFWEMTGSEFFGRWRGQNFWEMTGSEIYFARPWVHPLTGPKFFNLRSKLINKASRCGGCHSKLNNELDYTWDGSHDHWNECAPDWLWPMPNVQHNRGWQTSHIKPTSASTLASLHDSFSPCFIKKSDRRLSQEAKSFNYVGVVVGQCLTHRHTCTVSMLAKPSE